MPERALAVRLPDETIARLEAVADQLSARAAGAKVARSEVMRMAMERGLASLEKELSRRQR